MGDKKYDDEALQHVADLVAEQIVSQFKTATESIEEIKLQMAKIPAIHDDTTDLKNDMKAVKLAIKETNQDLRELEHRVDRLEAAYSA
jgi:predicted  nucleic acid-binding Zn-ribbon protein